MSPTTSSRLVDQDARDRIAHDLDATLIVEAAAGTGKTTALVERVLALLRSGRATLRSLVAVTFTEKAAGEMKLRLRTEIEKARTHVKTEAEHANLNRALSELEAANIGTIHAFCADILRERPVEAKVDPRFEVASESESERLYDQAFTRWFQDTLKNPGEGVSRVLRRTARERNQDGPRKLLSKAGFDIIGQRDFPTPYERPVFDREPALDAVIERLRAVAAYASKGFADSWLTKSLVEIGRTLFEIDRREGPRDYDAVEAMLRTLARSKCWGWKGSGQWFSRGISRQTVLDERAAAKEDLHRVLEAADADLAALLFREFWGTEQDGRSYAERGIVRTYEELKARAGKLDFLDLLALTRDLLVTNERVRRELQARFSHILVDEFQDTDPLQAEILLLLAGDDPHDADGVRVAAGKLFIVGDPKQSIYRFRRADIALYESIKARLLHDGASLVHLQTSFRSAPSIQRFVNAAFAPLMQPNAQRSQAAYVPLAPFRVDPVGQPTIIALPVPRPYTDFGRIVNFKIDESLPDAVGAFIDWLVNESGFTVTERGSNDRVKVGARHVCLLFKRLQSFGADVTRPYVRALEARRLPHVLVGGKSFHEREEVVAIRNALSAIEWPDDAMSVYATLHGPFFALGDDVLLAFKHTQKHLHPLRKRHDDLLTDLTRPVGKALDVLAGLHAGRNSRPIANTLAQFLEATRAHAGIAIWPAGEQALGNVLRVLDMARRFEQGNATSFRAFAARLADEAERGGANEAPVVEEGTDGVRIMTVHRAKGLEFPVVILVDPSANATFQEPSRYVDAKRKLWAMPLCGASPNELALRRNPLLDQDRDEAVRLLYVATTRARELLVFPVLGDVRDDKTDGWLEPLSPALYPKPSERRASLPAPGCPAFGADTVVDRPGSARCETADAVRPGLVRPSVGPHDVVFWDPHALKLGVEDDTGLRQQKVLAVDEKGTVARDGIEQHAAWQRARAETIAKASSPSVVVHIVTDAKNETHATIPVSLLATEASRGARPHGKRFGTLVHAVLANVELDADENAIADAARVEGRIAGASADEIDAARDAVASALEHPIFARARRGERVMREAPVMMRAKDNAIIEGVVDLAFAETGEDGEPRWVVVDFKTDVEIGARKDGYIQQIDTYARAIAAATGAVHITAILLSV
ncbi:MAG: UvrD-helicase domain-containing protein [Polyangiaceae bacterium]|nr:UvrD-helicase domain-containing protein [Polyangiaceae bacterium]